MPQASRGHKCFPRFCWPSDGRAACSSEILSGYVALARIHVRFPRLQRLRVPAEELAAPGITQLPFALGYGAATAWTVYAGPLP